ncbi:hypothetical protein QBC43DRAFT_318618 [Cladorrhinum sp. PSN259]|nr:hypothetical protein QBC43DRAFT_318618 [Cladorrhinum sp. PSN259]
MRHVYRHSRQPSPRSVGSGIASVSMGVAHQGKMIYQAGFGFSDATARVVLDEKPTYALGSLITALASAIKKVSWGSKLCEIHPVYCRKSKRPPH